MALKRYEIDELEQKIVHVKKRGMDLIRDPMLNKGSAFSDKEREEFNLYGLVPPHVSTFEEQIKRVTENYRRKDTDIGKYIFLEALHDRNEILYYALLLKNLEELTPIVYTPTVGAACQQFGHLFRRARGMYISAKAKGDFKKRINNWAEDEVDVIVVTDGSRILGLGDLGASGIGIPIGKLSLYVACAGIYPSKKLPVVIDVGTDNADLLKDPLYLGGKHPRIKGEEFYEIIDEFIVAAHERWPKALIQFEDFTNDHAFPLLNKYREKLLCFNDDIQGTGGVALAGLLASMRITKEKLNEQKIIFLGAGSAAVGIADMIVAGMMEEGLSKEEARKRFWFIDSKGLVTTKRGDKLAEHKVAYARNEKLQKTLLEIVKSIKPTVLMGVSKQTGAFDEQVVREMKKHVDTPIIFALSNPTSKSECTPTQAYEWTDGNVVYASGSPFDSIKYRGKTYATGQGNNMYIFPGVGLGAIVCQATKITDSMFYIAAKTLANLVKEEDLKKGRVYPDLNDIREISAHIAFAVCEVAYANGIAWKKRPENLLKHIKSKMFQPVYLPYKAV
ncbi:MAG: NAD-dependent malic enzyme [Armatimonadetes bacterium]|nr:NAD-dependent malic enzyme [Armatimonadota bacterium]